MRKDLQQVLRGAVRNGWTVSMRGSGHYRVERGEVSFGAPATPSDRRWVRAIRGKLRRADRRRMNRE